MKFIARRATLDSIIIYYLLTSCLIVTVSALQCYTCNSETNEFCDGWDIYAEMEEIKETCQIDPDIDDFSVNDFRCSFMKLKVGLRNEKAVYVRGCNFKGICPLMGVYNLSPTRNFTVVDCYTCSSNFCNKKRIPVV